MPLSEQQEYVEQISLFYAKLVHLEEALKIEDKEEQLKKKLEFHKENSLQDSNLANLKEQERADEEKQLQQEEGIRRSLINNMVKDGDSKLNPVKKVLLNLEGTFNLHGACFSQFSSVFFFLKN